MRKNSVSCHRVTAIVYSPASIFGSWGPRSNMLTPFYPFSWKWEESALQFYDLIPLGKISVAPGMSNAQGMENKKYAQCSLPLSMSVYVCYSYKHLHTKIFVCTLKYLCVGVTPESLPFAYKNKTAKLLYCCTCHLQASELHCFPLSGLFLSLGPNSSLCAEWVSRSEEKTGFRLCVGCG